jgi:hypothetical protein
MAPGYRASIIAAAFHDAPQRKRAARPPIFMFMEKNHARSNNPGLRLRH